MDPLTSQRSGIHLRAVGSFHVGGQRRILENLQPQEIRLAVGGPARTIDPNGSCIAGQMYVQFFLQQKPVCPWPLVLMHGGGMTGANWETTPDGRPGWLQQLLEKGWDVYVCDAVERGRSGWSRWPEIYQQAPLHRTMEEGWDMFRIGPPVDRYAEGLPVHPGQQFPAKNFEAFAQQWVPRWADHEAITLQAYAALIQKIGQCGLIAHSQGGGFALTLAANYPELLKAVVAIEPSGAPRLAPVVADPPHYMVVWGDYIQAHPIWSKYRQQVDQHVQELSNYGVEVMTLNLPSVGMTGNSHFPMLDLNSDLVLDHILSWLNPQTLSTQRST